MIKMERPQAAPLVGQGAQSFVGPPLLHIGVKMHFLWSKKPITRNAECTHRPFTELDALVVGKTEVRIFAAIEFQTGAIRAPPASHTHQIFRSQS